MRTASLLILVCCVLFACAAPTALRSSSVDGAMPSLAQPESGDELVGIAISGGGSRAATFASYVLEELARIDVGRDAPASMLERVQYISSVSGGSLSAAYYSMTKPDKSEPVLGSDGLSLAYQRFFQNYHTAMQSSWEEALWQVSLGDATRRAEFIAKKWDQELFHDATFSDLRKREDNGDTPRLILNGTSWDYGRRVVFTTLPDSAFEYDFVSETVAYLKSSGMAENEFDILKARMQPEAPRFQPITFDQLGADIGPLRVSAAVASSSSVPLLIGPVLFTVPMKDGSTQLLHIGDGGMFDNQGIESMAQLMFGKLRTKAGEQPSPRRGLVVLIDASYPFDGSGGLLSEAKSLLQLLDRSPSRVYDIMEQRAQAYQLMLWTVLRADAARRDAQAAGKATEGQVVPDTKHLRVIYLRHTDAAASMQVPAGCDVTGTGEERVTQLRAKLSRIPTRFKIDSKCDAPLLAAAAKALVAQERTRILEFFQR
jgi:hypothetical protein